jgi:phosphoglycerol transferase
LTVVAVLVAATGGLSTLIAVIWPQIRAWNRISVFIAFLSLAAAALLLGRLERRLRTSAFVAVLGSVLAVGLFDQTTEASVPPFEAVKAAWAKDVALFSTLEDRLPPEAMVVYLPYEPFPEPQPGLRDLYEPAKAYLHSDDLRWSYGAMRGRPEDWGATIAAKPAAEVVAAARMEGFAAILVDRLAYADGGVAIEAGLGAELGAESLRSPNGRFLFWRL